MPRPTPPTSSPGKSPPAPAHSASSSIPFSGAPRRSATLITGANGEFGHGLIQALHAAGRRDLVAVDVRELDRSLRPLVHDNLVGDVADPKIVDRLLGAFEVHSIYHLAALLSTRSEFTPETAHAVNVVGTLNLLHLSALQAASHGGVVRFLFPSSIAVYGLPNFAAKSRIGRIRESDFLEPTTMYGCNKLACEHLGRYYARHYRQLASDRGAMTAGPHVEFRCIRFPGVISAFTLPSGGTSDYAPEMIHAAAQGRPYACFVREDTRIPFMTMPDAVAALVHIGDADVSRLQRCIYNVSAFNPSAGEIASIVRSHFPAADITFAPDAARQAIVDSWPADVDDTAAREDWGYSPRHNLASAFNEYLIANIVAHYRASRG